MKRKFDNILEQHSDCCIYYNEGSSLSMIVWRSATGMVIPTGLPSRIEFKPTDVFCREFHIPIDIDIVDKYRRSAGRAAYVDAGDLYAVVMFEVRDFRKLKLHDTQEVYDNWRNIFKERIVIENTHKAPISPTKHSKMIVHIETSDRDPDELLCNIHLQGLPSEGMDMMYLASKNSPELTSAMVGAVAMLIAGKAGQKKIFDEFVGVIQDDLQSYLPQHG